VDTVPVSIERPDEPTRPPDQPSNTPPPSPAPAEPRVRRVRVRRLRFHRPRFRRPQPGTHWIPQLTAAVCGLLLVAAFPPIGWWWVAPPAVAGFTLSAQAAAATRVRRGLRRPAVAAGWAGFWFGLAFCVFVFKWLTTVGTDAWIILSIIEALYFIPLGAATAAVTRLRGAVLWQALMWIAEEALRDRWPLQGFSWGRLAFSQSHTVFTPLAALGGAPLVSFATALAGTALAALVLIVYRAARQGTAGPAEFSMSRGGRPGRLAWFAALGWLVLAVAVPTVGLLVPLQTTAGKPIQLAAIQGNVPRTGLDAYGQASAVLDNHIAVTEQYAAQVAAGKVPQPVAVFWPEDSDDVDPFQDAIAYSKLMQAAQAVHVPILVGAIVNSGPGQARNEGIVWDPATGPGETYTKRHLVPFGEYIPFRAQLTKYFSELSRVPRDYVPGSTPGVLTIGGVHIADVICFEVAYDDMVHDSVNSDTGVLVVQTNNATYGWSGQPEQQLAITQLRAVEHGRPVMIAATSGISGYITADGNVQQETKQFTPAVVAAEVTPRTGLTLADRVGAWPELAMTAVALLAWAAAVRAGRRSAVAAAPVEPAQAQAMQPEQGSLQSVEQHLMQGQHAVQEAANSSGNLAAAPSSGSTSQTPPARKART
jgi:apolipoprotein N-acyltransferase